MKNYSIKITFENNKTQEFVISKTSAAYKYCKRTYYFEDTEDVAFEIYNNANELAEITNSKKVELWCSKDEGNTWELLEKEDWY